ncbi:MAG: hypothetical protein WCK26_01180 [Candidatus Saccharibacteria bacterium]
MSLFSKKQTNIPRRRSTELSLEKSSAKNEVFKRNRTLAGTTSNSVNSANTKQVLESPRLNAHNLSIQRRKIASVLFTILLASLFIWFLVSNFTASATISVVDTSISKSINNSKYEKAIQEYLGVNPMSRFSFIMDQSALTAYVSNKLPEVQEIKQRNMDGIGRTNFSITMRTPIAGWQINDKQYYVDSKGIPFEQNYYTTPAVQIIDNSGISLKNSSTAIASSRFLSFVGRIVYAAKTNGYTVTQAALPLNTTRELEVRIKEGNYLVKLSIDRPAGEQVEDMVAAIRYFSSRGQVPEYIDIRVSGKAFYR